jgi:hypothetical protein
MIKKALAGWTIGMVVAALAANACIIVGYILNGWEPYEIRGMNLGHIIGVVAGAVAGGGAAGWVAGRGRGSVGRRTLPLLAPASWWWVAIDGTRMLDGADWPEPERLALGVMCVIASGWAAWAAGSRIGASEGGRTPDSVKLGDA